METHDFEGQIKWLMMAELWDDIVELLDSLTHSEHRKASEILANEAARADRSCFWSLALVLVRHNARAYLGTMLKAAPPIEWAPNDRGTGGDGCEAAEAFLEYLVTDGTEIDIQKTLTALLPRQNTPEDIDQLFTLLDITSPQRRAAYLIKEVTMPAAYVLFQTMREMEAERTWLLSLCRRLIKDGTTIGWSLASLARTYFDLPELKGTFSLTLQPYELSRLETSFDAFAQALG